MAKGTTRVKVLNVVRLSEYLSFCAGFVQPDLWPVFVTSTQTDINLQQFLWFRLREYT